MALSMEVALPSGVATRYHRVVAVSVVTNVQNTVEVCSYTSREKREEERAAIAAGEPMDVFTSTALYAAPYDQGMTVAGAYAWLKANVESLAGAADVLEGEEGERGAVPSEHAHA